MKRVCWKCIALRLRRNHMLSLCDQCAEDIANFLADHYDYSPVDDAEKILNG